MLPTSRYEASQPWPFPRSLMIGFNVEALPQQLPHTPQGYALLPPEGRAAAISVGLLPAEVESALLPLLQPPVAQAEELADVRWFHRDFLLATIITPTAGQPSPSVEPTSAGNGSSSAWAPSNGAAVPGHSSFSVPGTYSLAHRLITKWLGVVPSSVRGTSLDGIPGATNMQPSAAPQKAMQQSSPLLSFPTLSLDEGTFKYVLMRVTDPLTGGSKLCVWGDVRAEYHMDVLRGGLALGKRLGLVVKEVGGGRITHQADERKCRVYGYSAAFGAAPHEVSQAIIRRALPLYNDVTVSYDGY